MTANDKACARRVRGRTRWAGALVTAAFAFAGAASAQTYSTPQEAFTVGETFLDLGLYEKARGPLEQALGMASDDRMRLRVYKALLPVYFHAGKIDDMIASLDVILTKSDVDPDRRAARDILIRYAREQGKTVEVRERYEARLKTDPENIPALSVLSDIYSKLQPDPGRAGELVERLVAVMRRTGRDRVPYASANLAGQLVAAGKFRGGAALYEEAAANDPGYSAWCYKEAARAWLKAGDRSKALGSARKADAAPPEDRDARLKHLWHRNLGDVFLQLGDPARALPHFEAALEFTDKTDARVGTQKSLDQARALLARSGGGTTPTVPAAGAGPVDLNRASVAQLRSVAGISEDLAVEIVARRKAAPFSSVSELIELEGVDKSLLARVRPRLTANPK